MAKSKSKPVEFCCQAPEAAAVFLAGAFNEWRVDATPMKRDDDGQWTARVKLPPGRHDFKFVVDGEWCCEPSCKPEGKCPKCVPNDFGTMNRFIDVE